MVTTKRAASGTVRVTFELPTDIAAKAVAVCGDFNGWSVAGLPMRKAKNGRWWATVDVPAGRRYRYRYLIDGKRWENDWHADDYESNPYGGDDSVVVAL